MSSGSSSGVSPAGASSSGVYAAQTFVAHRELLPQDQRQGGDHRADDEADQAQPHQAADGRNQHQGRMQAGAVAHQLGPDHVLADHGAGHADRDQPDAAADVAENDGDDAGRHDDDVDPEQRKHRHDHHDHAPQGGRGEAEQCEQQRPEGALDDADEQGAEYGGVQGIGGTLQQLAGMDAVERQQAVDVLEQFLAVDQQVDHQVDHHHGAQYHPGGAGQGGARRIERLRGGVADQRGDALLDLVLLHQRAHAGQLALYPGEHARPLGAHGLRAHLHLGDDQSGEQHYRCGADHHQADDDQHRGLAALHAAPGEPAHRVAQHQGQDHRNRDRHQQRHQHAKERRAQADQQHDEERVLDTLALHGNRQLAA